MSKKNEKTIWIVNQYSTPVNKRTRQIVLSQLLEECGYSVFIICGSKVHGREENLIIDKEKFINIEYDGASFIVINTGNYSGNNIKRVIVSLQFQYNIRRLMKKLPKPDIIISDFAGLFGNSFLKWKRKFGTKIIFDILDLWPEDFVDMGYLKKGSLIAKILYKMEHKSYKEADGVVFSFEGGKDYIIEKKWDLDSGGDVDINKVGYLNNGVDLKTVDEQRETLFLDDPDLETNKFKVVYLGSIREANNVDILVDTARVLSERGEKDVAILVYGDGDQRKILEEKSEEYGLDNIIFKGRLPVEYAPNMLSRCDLMLFNFMNAPIIRFGVSPNKLFMYFASGKPVLSTIKPKYDLVESRECGIVVENEANAIADGIDRFRDMNELVYKRYCANSRTVAEEFDYKNLVSVLIKQIEAYD